MVYVVRDNLRIDVVFSYSSGYEMTVLATKVKDKNGVILHDESIQGALKDDSPHEVFLFDVSARGLFQA